MVNKKKDTCEFFHHIYAVKKLVSDFEIYTTTDNISDLEKGV